MAAVQSASHEFETRDIEYLRHGDKPLMARLYLPRGSGPFPAVVELHGGAWCNGDRRSDAYLGEALARHGIVVAALDFRMPPAAAYPASIADINYAVRWLKARSSEFGSRPAMVGAVGVSSGGHQGLLVGMKPDEPRYASLPLPAGTPAQDASLCCVALFCPVISPIGRYRYAKGLKQRGQPYPDFVDRVLPNHDAYWKTEAAMIEGDPATVLERGEHTSLPPVLYIQSGHDEAHPPQDRERFLQEYRRAGGTVNLEFFEGEGDRFLRDYPKTPASLSAMAKIVEFIRQHAD